MQRHITLVLLALLAAPVAAGERVDQRIDAAADGEVNIEVVRGKVRVLGWDENAVSVEGTLDDESEEFTFEREGRVITIEDDVRSSRGFGGRGRGTDITVRIPRKNSLDVSVVAVDLEVSDLAGRISADVVSGSLKVEKVTGELRLENVSGNIVVSAASDRIEAETVSGEVRVTNGKPLSRGLMSAVSGSVTVETALADRADLELESISGEIELLLTGDINARIDAETGPGGDIRNELTDEEPRRERYVGSESLELRLGNGSAEVSASVISGEIILRKR